MITHLVLTGLPDPPTMLYQHFLNLTDEELAYENAVNRSYQPREFLERQTERYGEILGTRYQKRYGLGSEFESWVKKNLGQDTNDDWYVDSGFTLLSGTAKINSPHSDPARRWHLFYLLTRGGEGCTTNFWLQDNHDIHRSPNTSVKTYQDLRLLDRVRFPERKWVLMNSLILHSVEDVTDRRTSIQVSMNRLPCWIDDMICSQSV